MFLSVPLHFCRWPWLLAACVLLVACDLGAPDRRKQESNQRADSHETGRPGMSRKSVNHSLSSDLAVASLARGGSAVAAGKIPKAPDDWRSWGPVFYRNWGETDGKEAMEAALREDHERLPRAANAALEGWAETDLAGAKRWVRENTFGRYQLSYARTIIRRIENPADAAEWLEGLDSGNLSNLGDAVSLIGSRWIQKDPVAALEWLASIQNVGLRERSVMAGFYQWARADSEAASGFLARFDPEHPAYPLAAEGLARAVAGSDAEAALSWAEQLPPESPQRSSTFQALLSSLQAETISADGDGPPSPTASPAVP